jgi:hypothetical protein
MKWPWSKKPTGTNVTVHLQGMTAGTTAELGRKVAEALLEYERRNGKRLT